MVARRTTGHDPHGAHVLAARPRSRCAAHFTGGRTSQHRTSAATGQQHGRMVERLEAFIGIALPQFLKGALQVCFD